MGALAHETRNQGHATHEELVGNAMHKDGMHAGIREDDLLATVRRRIPLEGRLGILEDERLDVRQLVEKLLRDAFRAHLRLFLGKVPVIIE